MSTLFAVLRRVIAWTLAVVLALAIVAVAMLAAMGWKLYRNAEADTPIESLYSTISSEADFVAYNDLPDLYVDAVVAVEDHRFWTHEGIDAFAIARALWTDLRTRSLAQGGSTISQQLVKNELFTQEKHFARKAAELFAALELERCYTKTQIYEMYVNTIYFGRGYYGIGEAAAGYFGKTPAELSTAELVLLVGLPNAPSAYAPGQNPELALRRARAVIRRMETYGLVSAADADALVAEVAALPILNGTANAAA